MDFVMFHTELAKKQQKDSRYTKDLSTTAHW